MHWYGLMYVLGFFVAWWGLRTDARRAGSAISPQQVEDMIFFGALGVFLGGRIGYMLFYNFDGFIADPVSIIYVWRGGMSFHGGLLGVLIAMGLYARRLGLGYFVVTDFIAPWIPPGIGFVRVGNFVNAELWGKPAGPELPWSVVYEGVPRHPSQLYEAGLEGLVLFLALFFVSRRPRPTMAVSGLFLLGYGSFRCAIEFIRLPDNGIYVAWGWLTKGQLLSLPMIIAGLALIALACRGRAAAPAART